MNKTISEYFQDRKQGRQEEQAQDNASPAIRNAESQKIESTKTQKKRLKMKTLTAADFDPKSIVNPNFTTINLPENYLYVNLNLELKKTCERSK